MSSESFYDRLPIIENFTDIANPNVYVALPDDWFVAVSDIKNSTALIQQGRYKDVNLVGASTIISILNLKKSLSLPFIFGGDGAAICVPPNVLQESQQALLATKELARDAFGIELRIGILPVKFIREQGYEVAVTRCRLSETCLQAAFFGGGLQFAEECLKDEELSKKFGIDESLVKSAGDFSGLECRWNNVPSVHGEIVTLIVQALGNSEENRNGIYRDLLIAIEKIYGSDTKSNPVSEKMLSMSFSEKQLYGESRIISFRKGVWFRVWYWIKIRYFVLVGKYVMAKKIITSQTDWGGYKKRLTANTDFKKFDDKFRQIFSGTLLQREMLEKYLQDKFQTGKLVYGIHAAESALVTCMIYDYSENHIHFVDASDGGYAIAALKMKEQLKSLK